MRQFNAPPQWPQPPRPDWRPPRRWRPPASWPAPPARWAFWVDEQGRPVRGPIGRYGGPRHVTVLAMVVVPIALITLVLLNPFAQNDTTSNEPLLRPSTTAPTTPVTRAPTRRTTGPGILLVHTPTPAPSSTTTSSTATTPVPTSSAPTATPTATPPATSSATSSAAPATTAIASPTAPSTPSVVPSSTATPVFKNCAEARAAGRAPLHRGDPGYSPALDHNGDGVACDRGNS